MNYKGSLQEYCQMKQISLPEYTTVENYDTQDSRFQSIVTVDNLTYTSTIENTKKTAETSAAQVALRHIKMWTGYGYKYKYKYKESKIILFDAENVLDVCNKYLELETNYNAIFFISEHHHMTERYKEQIKNKNIELITIDAIAKDAVDHAITLYLGRIIGRQEFDDEYILITRDRFGHTLRSILPKELKFTFISSMEGLLLELKQ